MKMAKKREKQQQLATLDSLSLSAVKREHVQMTQKRITKSRAGCPPATLPSTPLGHQIAPVRIGNGVKNVLTCDDAWKWHAKVFYVGRISFRQQMGEQKEGAGEKGI